MREWIVRLWDWLRRDRLERELAEELRFHRERLEQDARAERADPDLRAARLRLGNLPQIQEAVRDRWSWPWLEQLGKDLRYAFRGLRRSPAFTVTVVLTLGLGIGANATMFGVVDRLIFRPLPFMRDPDRVHRVYLQTEERGRTSVTRGGYYYTTYLDLKNHSRSFDLAAGFANPTLAIGSGQASREWRIGAVSASFFEFFDARPALGRYFGAAEDRTPSGALVVVLSYPFWQTEYGGRNVLGEILQIGNMPCTIIGVTPKGFIGIPERGAPVVFIPITTYAANVGGPDDRSTYFTRYQWGWMTMMVRRKPDVTVEAASADLSQGYLASWNAMQMQVPEHIPPAEITRPRAIAGPFLLAAGPSAGLEPKTLLWLSGVALIVLLIACANVANLMFARVLRRRRETAVRLALGVSRARLVRQALIESGLLAGLGLAAGLVMAQWGGGALRRLFLTDESLAVLADARTLLLSAVIAMSAALLAGVGPALLATRADLTGDLKAGVREGGRQRSRTRGILLVLQGALSVILLVGAGLFVQSFDRVMDLRMGYDARPVVVVSRNLRGMELPESERMALSRKLLELAQTIPGVEHAAVVSSVPFWSTSSTSLFVAGIDSVNRLGQFTYQTSTQDYFLAMDTRILRGRGFTEAEDRGRAPLVAVVSESMAQVLWPGIDPLGQCLRVRADTMPCTTVIGIAEDAIQRSLLGDEKPFRYYLPMAQYDAGRGNYLLIRFGGNPAPHLEMVRRTLQPLMPGESYVTVRRLEELIDNQRRSWKVGATMFVAFGGLAVLVAAVGLYGVITYNVTQRMHELGVRIALGAQARDLIRLVVGQGLRFALAGVALGLLLALLLSRWIQPLLFQQSARDPRTYGAVAAVLLLVALAASAVPARRAVRADPNTALRAD